MNAIGCLPDRLLLFKFNLPDRTLPKILRKNSKSRKILRKKFEKNSKFTKHLENFFIKLPILLNLLNMLPIFN